ncbi:PLP-dependent aminotransferase family protein [Undibacterium jejuense]|uniref:PLP-dependent aminotransferase family protein n=1 Tax=Undibacterium jejuense TaxID=1344949 RepID=A0A923HCK9_9BURK|nr:PLP-dependent aminotransferase family protein [Undibacterium jejuense]MBC3860530.1 PLP-dependent aminotransferase family protein [Undibacterium jejuense]
MQHSYRQIAEQLNQLIRTHQYQIGERLPSVRTFANQHHVSVSTVLRCYRYLESLGMIEARAKSGMYVADWTVRHSSILGEKSAQKIPSEMRVIEFDKLRSLQHRMTELYSLTDQPLELRLHLASAAPEWYPTKEMSKIAQTILRQCPEMLGEYPTGTGLAALKEQLVHWLATFSLDVQTSELLITNGSTEALSVALRAVAQAGDAIVVESPVYFGLLQVIENLGMKAIAVPCIEDQGMSMEALEYVLEHQTGLKAIVVMPNFQNPLGCTMPDKNKKHLLRLAEQYDLAVIEDDVFADLSPHYERPRPMKAWDKHGRVIYCGSCSKSMAPGFKVGWVAGGRHHAKIASLKLSHSLVTPLFEQAVLAEFMQTGALHAHLRKLRERLAANIPAATVALQTYFPLGTRLVSSAGGWWVWIALPQQIDALVLLRRAVAMGLSFTPGSLFSNSEKFSHYLRLNIAQPWGSDMESGMKLLGELVRELA